MAPPSAISSMKSLARKKEEEEEQERRRVQAFRNFSEASTRWEEGGAASSRRRKKRKKKKVPKTRRRPLPQLVACRVGKRIRRQEHGFALALRGSGARCMAVACAGLVFTGYDAPRVMFPSGVAKPRMLGILAGMDQKDSLAVACTRLVLLVTMHVALCSLPWFAGP